MVVHLVFAILLILQHHVYTLLDDVVDIVRDKGSLGFHGEKNFMDQGRLTDRPPCVLTMAPNI